MVMEMERNGIRIDHEHLRSFKSRITADMESLAAKAQELTGEEGVNLASPQQVAHLVFEVLKLKQPGREKKTKSKSRLSADSDVLKSMLGLHDVIRVILDWHEMAKLKSTYTDSLIAQMDENERVHSDLSTTRTNTNRISSSNPNLQNIPIRTKLGQEIRKAFIASPGNVIGSVDAGQIEMRMNAVDSNCEGLLNCFWGFEDVYWDTAERINHCSYSADDRAHGIVTSGRRAGLTFKEVYRQDAKRTALMVGYDSSPGGVYDKFLSDGVTDFTEADVGHMIIDYFKGYPELLTQRKVHHRRAYQHEYVWDMFGFVRWIPQVKSVHRRIVNEGLRQAGNLAGQGGAAGLVKLWMVIVWDRYVSYWRPRGIRMLMQIHDELLAEGPKAVLEDFFMECVHIMRNLIPYDYFPCPLDAGFAIANSWGEAAH